MVFVIAGATMLYVAIVTDDPALTAYAAIATLICLIAAYRT